MQLTTQPIEEHTITLMLPPAGEDEAHLDNQLQAEITRIIRGAARRHGQPLTYHLEEAVEADMHIYQLQIML